jgi:hypothetical protein
VTFALQFSYTTPGTVRKDGTGKPLKGPEAGPAFENEWHIVNEAKHTEENTYEFVSKTAVSKFGNKELLLGLIAAGKLPEYGMAPYIAGWSIVWASGSFTDDNGYTHDNDGKYYAVHKAPDNIVDLSPFIGTDFVGGEATTASYKDYFKEDTSDPENTKHTHTITSSDSWKETMKLVIDFEGTLGDEEPEPPFAELQGLFTSSSKLATVGTPKIPVFVYGASKLANISGTGPVLNEEDSDPSVPDGTITIGAGKAIQDASPYPGLILK